MYSIPESFLEIEVRNPQTHGAFGALPCSSGVSIRAYIDEGRLCRIWTEDVHRLRSRVPRTCLTRFSCCAFSLTWLVLRRMVGTDEHPRVQTATLARASTLL